MTSKRPFKIIRPKCFAILLLTAAMTPALAVDAAEVMVTLRSGRSFSAEISPRTNDANLWLRFGNRSTTLLRPIAWSVIKNAFVDGQEVSVDDLRQIAAEADSDILPQPVEQHAGYIQAPEGPTDAEIAQQWLGMSTVIRSVHFDVAIANWDADVEQDGFLLHLQPLDENRYVANVGGVLAVELLAPSREAFAERPDAGGLPTVRVERWSVRVTPSHWVGDGFVVKLPFRGRHPEFDTKLGPHGLVHVKFTVPGHGVFEYSQDGVRIRPFSPSRDRLELQTGRRFLATERHGR